MSKEKKDIITEEAVVPVKGECTNQFKYLYVDGTKYKTKVTRTFERRKPYVPYNPNRLFSFIPGTIVKVYVTEGDKVSIGTRVMVLDAMKMRNEIRSPIDGIVKKINVQNGESVPNKYFLIEFEEA